MARLVLSVGIAGCVVACASSARTYDGEPRSRDEVAIITDGGCSIVGIIEVDDHDRLEPDDDKAPHAWSSYSAEVLPGRHFVTVKWVSAWGEEFSGAVLASEIAIGMLSLGNPTAFHGVKGKRSAPAAVDSLQFSFLAEAGHRYRLRECDGPSNAVSRAKQRCWQYIGRITVRGGESTLLWLVDETTLREVVSP